MRKNTTRSGRNFEKIADGLEKDRVAVVDGFFSPDEVKALANRIHFLENDGRLKKAGIGKENSYQTVTTIRGDHIKWISEGDSALADLFLSRMEEFVQFLNRECYLGIKDMEFHFAKYPEGSFYKRHNDNFKGASNRLLSVVCYLNEDWEKEDGGQLRLFFEDANGLETAYDIDPVGGRIACFFSDMEHEVMLTNRERLSVTGWLLKEKVLF